MRKQSTNKKLQASVQLSRITLACRQVANSSDLKTSARTFLGNSTPLEPILHRRISQDNIKERLNLQNNTLLQGSSCVMRRSKVLDLAEMINSNWVYTSSSSESIQFLRRLYYRKTQDLNTVANAKHQKIFISRLKDKLGKDQFVARDCDLGKNCMKQICNYFLQNPIKILDLSKNPFDDQAVQILSKNLQQLQLISLSLVSINLSPRGAKVLIQAISKSLTLQKVDLSSIQGTNRNHFGKEDCQVLENFLKSNQCKINYLNFDNSGIGQQGFIALCNGVGQYSNLKQLIISQNQIKENSLTTFSLKFRPIQLQILDLKNNLIGDKGLQILIQLLSNHSHKNKISKSLRSLNISSNKIRSYGLQIFSRQMVNNQNLQQLYLDDNPLTQGQRFFNFKYYLARNWSLKKLSLKNTINVLQDLKSLLEGLQSNRSISYLNLSKNNLQFESFNNIVQLIKKNKCLKILKLNSCNISDSFIHKVQFGSIGLLEFSLQNNFINDKGAKILVKLLNQNNKINSLSLKRNCVGIPILRQIQKIIKDNQNFISMQQPDLSYYQYVQEIRNAQKSTLAASIQKLKEKQQKQKVIQLICDIVEKQRQIGQKKININQQKKKIVQLEIQIDKKKQKIFPTQ